MSNYLMNDLRGVVRKIQEVEGATYFEPGKLKTISMNTIRNLMNRADMSILRVAYDGRRDRLGGTKKDTLKFIKALIDVDSEAGKELGFEPDAEKLADYKYLKSIK